ncbi:hypothetical protein BGZ65_008978, partial [Modicella reniformis]
MEQLAKQQMSQVVLLMEKMTQTQNQNQYQYQPQAQNQGLCQCVPVDRENPSNAGASNHNTSTSFMVEFLSVNDLAPVMAVTRNQLRNATRVVPTQQERQRAILRTQDRVPTAPIVVGTAPPKVVPAPPAINNPTHVPHPQPVEDPAPVAGPSNAAAPASSKPKKARKSRYHKVINLTDGQPEFFFSTALKDLTIPVSKHEADDEYTESEIESEYADEDFLDLHLAEAISLDPKIKGAINPELSKDEFHELTEIRLRDSYPLPRIDNLLDTQEGVQW